MVEPDVIVGTPPVLRGKICEALLIQEYWYDDTLADSANVCYVKATGVWHRLCIDSGVVFWRCGEDPPESSWGYIEEGQKHDFRIIDAAAQHGIFGVEILSYDMQFFSNGASVEFRFQNGLSFILQNADDRTCIELNDKFHQNSHHVTAGAEHTLRHLNGPPVN